MDERLKKIAVYRTNDPELNKQVLDRFDAYGAKIPESVETSGCENMERVYMVDVQGKVFVGSASTVISKEMEVYGPQNFLHDFPEKYPGEPDDDTPDIFGCAVYRVRNFDINNAVVGVFEKHGGTCTLSQEEMSPGNASKVFIMDSDKNVKLIRLSEAYERNYMLFSPQIFLDEFVGKPSIEARDRMMEKKEREQEKNHDDNLPTPEEIFGNDEPEEKQFPFPVAFYGEKDSNKSDIIARVFKKHGLCKDSSWSFGIEGAIYCIQNSRTIYSNGNARSFIEKGFVVTTIDKYLEEHPEDRDCIPAPEVDGSEKMLDEMEVNTERDIEFHNLSLEILEFLNKSFCHPHMTIIADSNHVELVEGLRCVNKDMEE